MNTRPSLYINSNARSIDDIRAGLHDPYAASLWEQLTQKVDQESAEPAWTPKTPLQGRSKNNIEHANREFELVAFTANRILDASLVALIQNNRQYVDTVLAQIRSIYDNDVWPEIEDKTHLVHGDHCSLRRGQLAVSIGCAFDWLYNLLDESERLEIISGFDRRFTKPYRAALEAGDRWVDWRHNFCAVIYGGFAIAGMAFGENYTESDWLIQTGQGPMAEYFDGVFGPEGEFNESVQYAGSAAFAVHYLMAQKSTSLTEMHPISTHRFDAFCRWYMHFTFPPGRVAGFGDPSPDSPPVVFHYSAVASALRDSTFQWFYRQYADYTQPTHRKRALELLYYDPTVPATSPEGHLPRGHAYHAQGKLITSRSSWDPKTAISVAYAKAARESNHSHPDWGQVCLDGYGERLLCDLGSPPAYPRTHREHYYNYQQWGHNVLVFGKNETGGIPAHIRDRVANITNAQFDDNRGGYWQMDLTPVYDNVQFVQRTVVHLLPRILVVIDDAKLREEMDISLRWHTASPPHIDQSTYLTASANPARLVGCVKRLDGDATLSAQHHAYQAPYNVDALGDLQPQRNEPYVELSMTGVRCQIASLFCVQHADTNIQMWTDTLDGWQMDTPEGLIQVTITDNRLYVEGPNGVWEQPLRHTFLGLELFGRYLKRYKPVIEMGLVERTADTRCLIK